MLRGNNPSSGLTLMELLISIIIVGVIMMGVVSSDYAIRKHSDSATNSASASINLQGYVAHILNNASLAIGNAADKGILIGAEIADVNSFCIRIASTPTWRCYTGLGAGSLYTCTKAAAGTCTAVDTGYTSLGTVSSVVPTFTLNSAVGTSQVVFGVTVTVADTSTSTGTRSLSGSLSPSAYSY